MNKSITGISILELLVSVGITGMLVAVAWPYYQNFVARTQFVESHSLLGAARIAVQERAYENRTFDFADLSLRTGGRYGELEVIPALDVATALNGANTYTLRYEFGRGGSRAAPGLSGRLVSYTYTVNTERWTCGTDAPQSLVTRCPGGLQPAGVN